MRGMNRGNINSARMATVTTVTLIVAFAPVLCGLAQSTVSKTGDCSRDQQGAQVVEVNQPNTVVTLKCNEKVRDNVKPAFNTEKFMVCTQAECASPQELSKYIDGATGKKDSEVIATVTIKDLPKSGEKTFYIQCGEAKKETCYIQVNVAQAPGKPELDENGEPGVPGGVTGSSGGVTTGGPLSCTTPGGAITIKLPEQGSTAEFTCGDMKLYPLAANKVFAADCKKEESLKDIVRSAKDGNAYKLTAEKKPPKKKWCYLCAKSSVTSNAPGHASDYCLVHVESSSRTQSSSAIALAAVLPCILAMLRIT